MVEPDPVHRPDRRRPSTTCRRSRSHLQAAPAAGARGAPGDARRPVGPTTSWPSSRLGRPPTPTTRPAEIVTRTSSFEIERASTAAPARAAHAAVPPGLRRWHDQQRGRQLLAVQPAADPQGRRTGIQPLLDQAAARSHRQTRRDRRSAPTRRSPRPTARTGPARRPGRARTAPAARRHSQIGRTWSARESVPSLTYVPGKVYLAGPYKGSKLSIVAITTAKVGPFDLGTVVIRQALRVDPNTAEVFVRRLRLGPDPPHPPGDRRPRPRHPGLRRPARLRPQPDQLRTDLTAAVLTG